MTTIFVGLPVDAEFRQMDLASIKGFFPEQSPGSGYYQKPEETAKVIKEGWFYSGDIGKFDEDGMF